MITKASTECSVLSASSKRLFTKYSLLFREPESDPESEPEFEQPNSCNRHSRRIAIRTISACSLCGCITVRSPHVIRLACATGASSAFRLQSLELDLEFSFQHCNLQSVTSTRISISIILLALPDCRSSSAPFQIRKRRALFYVPLSDYLALFDLFSYSNYCNSFQFNLFSFEFLPDSFYLNYYY